MVVETAKIFGDAGIKVAPDGCAHPRAALSCENVNVEFNKPVTPDEARDAFEAAASVTVMDDPGANVYPMPGLLQGTDDAFVGRIRQDPTVEGGLAFWLVMDQIRKGAALNAVQIAEELLP